MRRTVRARTLLKSLWRIKDRSDDATWFYCLFLWGVEADLQAKVRLLKSKAGGRPVQQEWGRAVGIRGYRVTEMGMVLMCDGHL